MQFAYGATRWVILTERYAIKIARFRPVRPFVRLLQLLREGGVIQTLEKHDANLCKAVLKYVGAGPRANRTEYRLYKKYGAYNDLAPTLFTVFWIINVQLRGEPSKEEDVRRHPLWQILGNTPFVEAAADLRQPKQFCIIGSKVCLADYGMEILEPVLAAYSGKI